MLLSSFYEWGNWLTHYLNTLFKSFMNSVSMQTYLFLVTEASILSGMLRLPGSEFLHQ